jgi:hypothetical protein
MEGENLIPKKNHLMTYGALAAGGVVILLVLFKRGGTAAVTDTSGGNGPGQPVIISGGGGTDPSVANALGQMGQNQQTLADEMTTGFQTIADAQTAATDAAATAASVAATAATTNQTAATVAATAANATMAEGIAKGFTGVTDLFNARPAAQPAGMHTFFGASADTSAAREVFGSGSNMSYVDTTSLSSAQIRTQMQAAGTGAMIVGGYNAGGGVDNNTAQGLGIVRVAGVDRAATLAALRNVSL